MSGVVKAVSILAVRFLDLLERRGFMSVVFEKALFFKFLPAQPVIPAKAGISSTHRWNQLDSQLLGTDGVNETENKKFALKKQEFLNQTGKSKNFKQSLSVLTGNFHIWIRPVREIKNSLALIFIQDGVSKLQARWR